MNKFQRARLQSEAEGKVEKKEEGKGEGPVHTNSDGGDALLLLSATVAGA
jgi:hypothetical protein